MSFTYDSDGLRLTKNVDGVEHRYTWQGGKLISETWGGKKIEFFYGPEGSIDGFNYKAGPNSSVYVYYYVKNLQGDVVAIINKDGELRAEYTYDPFGKVLSATGTMADINPIRYRGYYYDQELGFYYLQSRYYDPNLCRFINADGLASTGQGFLGCNMFAYCYNDPVIGFDPSGFYALCRNERFTFEDCCRVCLLVTAFCLWGYANSPSGQRAISGFAKAAKAADAVEKATKPRTYTVYFLQDDSNTIRYVGRVTDESYTSRMAYHLKTKGLSPAYKISGLSYFIARGMEEIGMIECHTLNPGRIGNNQIHGIGPRNKSGEKYLESALNYLENKAEQTLLNLFF